MFRLCTYVFEAKTGFGDFRHFSATCFMYMYIKIFFESRALYLGENFRTFSPPNFLGK
jgi:hypothetical protein